MTEALLMVGARVDHLEKTILPALAKGQVVICDRFADSTMAYQGIAGDIGQENVNALHKIAIGNVRPDLTFVLTLSSREGLVRANNRQGEGKEDRFELKGADFQAGVHEAFDFIADTNPDRCVRVETSGEMRDVADKIFALLSARHELTEFARNE